jgi:hypothetical protein
MVPAKNRIQCFHNYRYLNVTLTSVFNQDLSFVPKKSKVKLEISLQRLNITTCFYFLFVEFFSWKLTESLFVCHTNTVTVIWRRSSFTGGGRPQVPFRALFLA